MRYASELAEVEVIPSGLFIDKLTGIGGIPRGVITEIFGDEGVGKSSLCLQIVAAAQKQGLRCLWVDVEFSYALGYAASLGVDNSKLGLIRDRIAESVIDQVVEEIDTGDWDLVVFDSIGGATARAELEKSSEGKVIGAQAGLVARFCRRIVGSIAPENTNTAVIVINHSFVDIMSGKIMSSGGKKLAFHKAISIRLKNKMGMVLKQGDRKVGRVVVGEVKKNKLAPTEGLEVEGNLLFGEGFSAQMDLLQEALDRKIITKEGRSYFFEGQKVSSGLPALRQLCQDENFAAKLKAAMV